MSSFPPITPATSARGLRNQNLLPAGQIVPDVWDDFRRWDPDAQRFLTMLMSFNEQRTIYNPRFSHWEERPLAQVVQTNGAHLAGATTIQLAAGEASKVTARSLLLVDSTREVMLVTAVSTALDQLTVTRSIGDESGPATDFPTNNETLLILGEAHLDGGPTPEVMNWLQSEVFNYSQIFRTGIGTTRRGEVVKLYGGHKYADTKTSAASQHKRFIQNALLFGNKSASTGTITAAGSQTVLQHTTGGLEEFIKTNVVDFGGVAPSWKQFQTALEPIFTYGKNGGLNGKPVKHLFASPLYFTLFANWGWDKLNYMKSGENSPQVKNLGIEVESITTAHGDLVLHRMWDFNLTPAHRKTAFVVDLADIQLCVMAGADGFPSGKTSLQEHIETPGTDGRIDGYISDMGIAVRVEAAHGLLRGVGNP